MADWLKGGSKRGSRKHAKNFISKQAQKRLDEVIPTVQDQLDNALGVDSHEVIVYKQSLLGKPCSCNKYDAVEMDDYIQDVPVTEGMAPVVESQDSGSMSEVSFGFPKNSMFGGAGECEKTVAKPSSIGGTEINLADLDKHHYDSESRIPESHDLEDMPDNLREVYEENLMVGNSVNCGVCFRTGFSPGFTSVGWSYNVLSAANDIDIEGYHKDVAEHPVQFKSAGLDERFVDFIILVPKFFKECVFSVREGEDILLREPIFQALPNSSIEQEISKSFFDQHRGKEVRVRVRAECFTHAILCFDLGLDPILANLSEEGNSLNYDADESIGDLTVILPPRVGQLRAGDIIHVPSRNYTLKVTEAPRKQTSKRDITEWAVSTRTLQPSEPIKNIHKGYKLK